VCFRPSTSLVVTACRLGGPGSLGSLGWTTCCNSRISSAGQLAPIMWVLAPLPGNASPSPSQQQTIYLTSGEISIGRPLKKGSTVGKADILIFNEQSVSTIHAKLQVDEASQQHHGFSHGSISITGVLHGSCSSPAGVLGPTRQSYYIQLRPFALVAATTAPPAGPEPLWQYQ
jgi:hypothetical protein